jgi:hypothetical protein
MTAPSYNPEVIAANRAGRLHPSQRRIVIDPLFWTFLGIAIAFIVLLVVLPLTTDVLHGSQRAQTLGGGAFAILLIVACLVFCACAGSSICTGRCSWSPAGPTTSAKPRRPTPTPSACISTVADINPPRGGRCASRA